MNPMEAEMFRGDGQPHDEANGRLLQFCERAQQQVAEQTGSCYYSR
jgi:hypothetical protein